MITREMRRLIDEFCQGHGIDNETTCEEISRLLRSTTAGEEAIELLIELNNKTFESV